MVERKQLAFYSVSMGCDPEFFIAKDGKIIGSEKVVSEKGIVTINYGYSRLTNPKAIGKVIRDGVQVELNPRPNLCRANLGNEMRDCFNALKEKIEKDKSLSMVFDSVISLDKKELDSLSKKSKEFGCAASNNLYTGKKSEIRVDPNVYLLRSAGGHIHLGSSYPDNVSQALHDPTLTVALLDIVLGNTCVLIDRDPYAVERRKVYGRAGEYRTPTYGIEYRTLSNFWLKSYQLMSLVFGLARLSVIIAANIKQDESVHPAEKSYFRKIFDLVEREEIVKAINTNHFGMAKRNFNKIKDFIVDITYNNGEMPLYANNIKYFEHFIKRIRKEGLDYWFKEDPLVHWIKMPEGHGHGWESFSENEVMNDMKK